MAEKKPTPRSSMIIGGAAFAGLIAAVVGQKYVPWTLESQTNTILVVVPAAIVGGVIAWFLTRKPS